MLREVLPDQKSVWKATSIPLQWLSEHRNYSFYNLLGRRVNSHNFHRADVLFASKSLTTADALNLLLENGLHFVDCLSRQPSAVFVVYLKLSQRNVGLQNELLRPFKCARGATFLHFQISIRLPCLEERNGFTTGAPIPYFQKEISAYQRSCFSPGTWAEAELETTRGVIAIRWEKAVNELKLNIKVPRGQFFADFDRSCIVPLLRSHADDLVAARTCQLNAILLCTVGANTPFKSIEAETGITGGSAVIRRLAATLPILVTTAALLVECPCPFLCPF